MRREKPAKPTGLVGFWLGAIYSCMQDPPNRAHEEIKSFLLISPSPVLSLVMGLGQNLLTRVSSGQFFVCWVSHLWFGCEFGKFPLKMSNFSIFSLWVKKYPGQRRVGTWTGEHREHWTVPMLTYLLFVVEKFQLYIH